MFNVFSKSSSTPVIIIINTNNIHVFNYALKKLVYPINLYTQLLSKVSDSQLLSLPPPSPPPKVGRYPTI